MVRRIATLIVSSCMIVGFGFVQFHSSFGQDAAKKDAPQKAAPAQKEASPSPATKTAEPAKTKEAPQPTEAPLPPIPKEVQEKMAAAQRAVAELIVAAEDAGLVETSIDPPPILDILISGRALDGRLLKNTAAKKPYGLSPEVFCAWFTGYTVPGYETIDRMKDIRIVNPSAGLKDSYDQRAAIMRNLIAEIRKSKPAAKPATPAPKPADTKPATPAATPTPAPTTPPAAKPAAPAAKPAEAKPAAATKK